MRSSESDRELLGRYVEAFERYDMDALTSLIQEDATQSMPPYDLWLSGRDDIFRWWFGPGIGCQGSRVIPTFAANGSPAFGQYKPAEDGGYEPWALQVLEIEDGRIKELTFFLETETLFPLFGLPPRIEPLGAATTAARAVSPMNSTSARSSSDAFCRRTVQPCRRAPSWSCASASTVTASGAIPATSQYATSAPLEARSAQTRSQSPGRSARPIGPQTANVMVRGSVVAITR